MYNHIPIHLHERTNDETSFSACFVVKIIITFPTLCANRGAPKIVQYSRWETTVMTRSDKTIPVQKPIGIGSSPGCNISSHLRLPSRHKCSISEFAQRSATLAAVVRITASQQIYYYCRNFPFIS